MAKKYVLPITHRRAHCRATLTAALALGLLAAGAAGAAHAATYKYTGTHYYVTQGGTCLTLAMHVSASFTITGKLPKNSSYLSVNALSWKLSDGVTTSTSKSHPGSQVINVSTDAHSKITAWDLSTQYVNSKGEYVLIETANEPAAKVVEDYALDGTCKTGGVEAISSTPGTW